MSVAEKFLAVILNLKKGRPSFSQDGEDIVLYNIFEEMHITKGFYVDIGAHHPFRYSNTYIFYQKGWSGINVEPTPGRINLFRRFRSRDINLQSGIGPLKSNMDFYGFDEPALNTFDNFTRTEREREGFPVISTVSVPVIPLAELLHVYLPRDIAIDFMTVDAEGMDLDILKSNDWRKYRPTLIVVEDTHFEFGQPENSEIYQFMKGHHYYLFAKLRRSAIYKESYEA
ncbi:MAG: FkbM family methyltransferase [Ignavibacteriales bacterium]|nr:FkbM family methyltransferase [Ignavibacteriales bacterium]